MGVTNHLLTGMILQVAEYPMIPGPGIREQEFGLKTPRFPGRIHIRPALPSLSFDASTIVFDFCILLQSASF